MARFQAVELIMTTTSPSDVVQAEVSRLSFIIRKTLLLDWDHYHNLITHLNYVTY